MRANDETSHKKHHRFLVILIFSSLYLLGLGGTTAVNIVPSLKPQFNAPPASGSYGATRALFWAFMYLIALGGWRVLYNCTVLYRTVLYRTVLYYIVLAKHVQMPW